MAGISCGALVGVGGAARELGDNLVAKKRHCPHSERADSCDVGARASSSSEWTHGAMHGRSGSNCSQPCQRAPHLRHAHAPLAQGQQPRLCAHSLDVRATELVLQVSRQVREGVCREGLKADVRAQAPTAPRVCGAASATQTIQL